MRRLPHGATTGPGTRRPGNGYGRRPGRPGPDGATRIVATEHRRWWRSTSQVVDALVSTQGAGSTSSV